MAVIKFYLLLTIATLFYRNIYFVGAICNIVNVVCTGYVVGVLLDDEIFLYFLQQRQKHLKMSYHSKTQWSEESKKFLQTKKVVDIFKGSTARKVRVFNSNYQNWNSGPIVKIVWIFQWNIMPKFCQISWKHWKMWETTKSFFKTIKEAHKVGKDNPKSIRILFPLLKKRKGSKMKYPNTFRENTTNFELYERKH